MNLRIINIHVYLHWLQVLIRRVCVWYIKYAHWNFLDSISLMFEYHQAVGGITRCVLKSKLISLHKTSTRQTYLFFIVTLKQTFGHSV